MKAKIYYAKLTRASELESGGRFAEIYTQAHFRESHKPIRILSKDFKRIWSLMATEDVEGDNNLELESLFERYNRDDNPLGTDAGQEKVRKSGTHHTSMSVMDIVKIGTHYYMVGSVGWRKAEIV